MGALEKALDAAAAPVPAGIAPLARKLGNDSWAVRENAQKRLVELGPAALPTLKVVYLETKDFEVQARIEQIFRTVLPPRDLREALPIGFLGVQIGFQLESESTGAILIYGILPDTGAEKAGIQSGDVIIGFNGRELDPKEGINGFRFRIMSAGKGAVVTVKARRENEVREFIVTLGEREPSSLSEEEQLMFEHWYWQRWFEAHVKTRKQRETKGI